jgi:hypothetical protein
MGKTTSRYWAFPSIHIAGLIALIVGLARYGDSPTFVLAWLFCAEALWLAALVGVAVGAGRRLHRNPSLRSALTQVVPPYFWVPACGLMALGATYLPLTAMAGANDLAITQALRTARFGFAVVQTALVEHAAPSRVPKLLADLAAGRNLPDTRLFFTNYGIRGQSKLRAERAAEALAPEFRFHPNTAYPPRWSVRSTVMRDPANGRRYYVSAESNGSVELRWLKP